MRLVLGALAASLSCAACVASNDGATTEDPAPGSAWTAPDERASDLDLRELVTTGDVTTDERIGQAPEASTAGDACRAYCATAYTAACVRVSTLCLGAEVVSIGGASVPCATAIAAVCISAATLGSICNGKCQP